MHWQKMAKACRDYLSENEEDIESFLRTPGKCWMTYEGFLWS